MQNIERKRTFVSFAWGFAALWAGLVLAVGLSLWQAQAAPFAYVANSGDCTVSVIDTATNTVVATIPAVGLQPYAVAVTPDGTHVYVANFSATKLCPPNLSSNSVSVIATATNTVVATVPVGSNPTGVAVTPDGTRAYVTNLGSGTVSVINTATNTVGAMVSVGPFPTAVAVTPDGKHVYVTAQNNVSVIDTATNMVVATVGVGGISNGVAITQDGKKAYVTVSNVPGTVSVIDTGTNMVVGTVPVEGQPFGIAITPDGTLAYVVNFGGSTPTSHDVSVIATVTNTVVATVPEGPSNQGLAITPDGKNIYVANDDFNNVLVIDTASNAVVATVSVGQQPFAVGIGPPTQCVPFSGLDAKLAIAIDPTPNQDAFGLLARFTLGGTSNGIDPVTEPVTLQIGTLTATIPPGSFTKSPLGTYTFLGMINGINLDVVIPPIGGKQFALEAAGLNANLSGTKNPVTLRLTISDDCGTASVNALIF